MIGWLTTNAQPFLIGWLIMSGAIVFVRGIAGTSRRYTMLDSILGAIEIAFLVWLVTVVGR